MGLYTLPGFGSLRTCIILRAHLVDYDGWRSLQRVPIDQCQTNAYNTSNCELAGSSSTRSANDSFARRDKQVGSSERRQATCFDHQHTCASRWRGGRGIHIRIPPISHCAPFAGRGGAGAQRLAAEEPPGQWVCAAHRGPPGRANDRAPSPELDQRRPASTRRPPSLGNRADTAGATRATRVGREVAGWESGMSSRAMWRTRSANALRWGGAAWGGNRLCKPRE